MVGGLSWGGGCLLCGEPDFGGIFLTMAIITATGCVLAAVSAAVTTAVRILIRRRRSPLLTSHADTRRGSGGAGTMDSPDPEHIAHRHEEVPPTQSATNPGWRSVRFLLLVAVVGAFALCFVMDDVMSIRN